MSASEGRPEAGVPSRSRGPRNVPGSGWVPASPPIGFPVYGLDGSWQGARWLDSFGDQVGDPPRWVRLGHQRRVDGATVAARVSWFADGWAAVSDAIAEVYLSAVGIGAGPDSLSLTRLQDGAAYHFDLDQPLGPGVLSASRRAAGVQSEAPPDT